MQCNAMEDFKRQIGVHLLKRGDGSAFLTGTIQDRFHDIVLEVEVSIADLTISAIRVDFRQSPSLSCQKVAVPLATLIGMTIGPGMSRQLMVALGGPFGCGNLRNLLQSLLPLVLNLTAATGIEDEEEMLTAIHRHLVGTCAGYTDMPPAGK